MGKKLYALNFLARMDAYDYLTLSAVALVVVGLSILLPKGILIYLAAVISSGLGVGLLFAFLYRLGR